MYCIGGYAFAGCQLTGVAFPGDYVNIQSNAFFACIKLTGAALPFRAEVEADAFKNCDRLTDVYYRSGESQWAEHILIRSGNEALTSASIHYNS